ncbi:MAG TPA: HAD family hydrolase, partial [Deltaproteobacteria bacterium]|nr:HAD family hydrolase [Deltaproteobacteria bacterium]
MGRRLSISFDLDGTLTTNRFVDSVWLEGVPGLLARKRGIDPDRARRLCMEEYAKVGEDSILWYRLPYWLEYFDLKDATPEELVSQYTSTIELFDDVVPVLETLKAEGFTLILFSNAARVFLDAE